MKHLAWIVALGLLSGLLGSRLPASGCKLQVISLPQVARERLEADGHRLRQVGPITIVEGRPAAATLESLAWAYQVTEAIVDCAHQNLSCANSTKMGDATPYRRRFVSYDARSRRFGERPDWSEFKWVYDPSNPEAEKSGEHAGYVAMPNVNVIQERAAIAEGEHNLQILGEAMQQLEPRLITGYRPGKSS